MGRNLIRAGLVSVALALAAPAAGQAATYTVNTEADNAPLPAECSGLPLDCSLRQAIDKAVNDDVVALPAGHYTVGSTLDINKRISIDGTGNPVVDGGHAVRVFRIGTSGEVSISGVTVTGGRADQDAGGAFLVPGRLTLTNSTVTDSDAGVGAGIALTNLESFANLLLVNSTISGNRAESQGGGIWSGAGKATLINSTVTGNTAGSSGQDGQGGGIYSEGNADDAFFAGVVHSFNSTIVDNTALGAGGAGGNLFIVVTSGPFAVAGGAQAPDYLLRNTILADGKASTGANCGGDQPASDGNNLVNTLGECGTSSGKSDVSGPANVSPLKDNGGPTLTRKLLPGSKAIDNGNASGCKDDQDEPITTDQRIEMPRPRGPRCDIGAVEFAPPLAVTGQPQNVTKSDATITGDVSNLHIRGGTSYFEFGTSTAYGQTFDAGAVAPGASHDPRTQGVTGLSPNTLYHYRIVVQNEDDTSFGEDVTFITPTSAEPEPEPEPEPGRPNVRTARASSGCVRRRLGVRVSVAGRTKLRRVDVTVDGRRVKRTTRRRFSVHVNVRHLKPGGHLLRVIATDTNGRTKTSRRMFRVCRARSQPAFTG